MNQRDKLVMLRQYFKALDTGFQERETGELMMVLKALLVHLSYRLEIPMNTFLLLLAEDHEEKVMKNRDKTGEELEQMLLDEMARQEELHSDA